MIAVRNGEGNMKYCTEMTNDAFSYFEWFSKYEAKQSIGYAQKLSV
jgi:hypothetical protein